MGPRVGDVPGQSVTDLDTEGLPAERFAALATLHTAAMIRLAAALVGIVEAEDAAQEALERAWKARATLRNEWALRAWLLQITLNVCRQWRRGSFGRHLRLTQSLPDNGTDVASLEGLAVLMTDPGGSDHTGALDLRHAVNHLPTDFRIAIILRYYGGMEPTEIAAALGIPPTTVRTRLHRALLLLRERLHRPATPPSATTESER
jgi:RNA polymerase sigma-70 factor (ECF subfamily)